MKLSIREFLTSGIRFEPSEENLEFRIRFLNSVALIAILASVAFIGLDARGIRWMDPITLRFTVLEALVSFLLILNLRGRKQAYGCSAWILLVVSYLAFASALLYIVNDELRAVWFLIWVVAAYVMLGTRAGLATTLVSLLTVVFARFVTAVSISNDALYTFVLTLGVASGMTYAYTRLANSYYRRMTSHFAQMQLLANRDSLTGLWNARFITDASSKMFSMARRSGSPLCLLFIDIDHFKAINDRHGHAIGDQVLCAVAALLSAPLRQSDLLGRIGGEEFVVLMPDTDLDGARILAEKLRLAVEQGRQALPPRSERGVTVSIGVADARPTDASTLNLQKRADAAMYQAKQQGRNRVVTAVPGGTDKMP